jgi:hypothetical protein
MTTPINKNVNARFVKSTQPAAIVADAETLEEGVKALLGLATASQRNLVTFMTAIAEEVKKSGIQATFYDPGIKSYESALRKAKKGYGVPNQIRLLTDPYRGSMILGTYEGIKQAEAFITKSANDYGFEIVYDKNTFNQPWSNGYRDINYKFADKTNQGLVGELQLQLCAVKKFTEIAGHKAYEVARELPTGKNNVKAALEEVTRHGYNRVTVTPNASCMSNIEKLHGGRRRTRRQSRSYVKHIAATRRK